MANKKEMPTKELSLNRYLYLMSEEPRYIAGEPHVHKYFTKERLLSINQFIDKKKEDEIIPIIEKAVKNSTCPNRDAAIFALAVCTRSENNKLRTAAYAAIKNVCETTNDIHLFIKFFIQLSEHKGFGMGFRKCINKWYLGLEPMHLADTVTKVRSKHGWSHKDIFKMTHPRTTDKAKEAILTYVFYGLKKADEKFANVEEAKAVLDHFRLIEKFKHCEEADKLAQMIEEYNLKIEHVPFHFHKNPEIWNVLIPRLSYKTLLNILPRLSNFGLLKQHSPVLAKVLTYLNTPERVKASGIHPVQVLIALRNYEHNGRCPDYKKLEYYKDRDAKKAKASGDAPVAKPPFVPNSAIVNALGKVLYQSFQNPARTNVSYMISIDTRDHMNDKCFKCGNVSAYEAAVIIVLYLLKSQKDVVIAVFNDRGVHPVNLEKGISFKDAESRLRNIQSGHTLFQKPFDWAEKKKKNIDVFINIFHSPKVYFQMPKEMRTPPINMRNCLEKYRKNVHAKSKLISMSLCCHKFASATGISGMIDICGFDENVPKIIESFANDSFN